MNTKGRHYSIFTDGSKNQDGVGCAAIGTINVQKKSLPKTTSIYTAELRAIKEAIDIIDENQMDTNIIYSDSQSAIKGIREYNPTNPLVMSIQEKIHEIKSNRNTSMQICWIPAHVGVPGNEYADQAAKEAAQAPPEDEDVPARDIYQEINKGITNKWQNEWNLIDNTNKLKLIKKEVKEWTSSHNQCRKIEVTLTRLRTGHTNITHSHLMNQPHEPEPICNTCRCPVTVKHIIELCPKYEQERRRNFGNKKIDEILGESDTFSSKKVISFLKETKLIDKI